MRKVVILTALSVERKAVRAHLQNLDEVEHPRSGTVYDRGIFTATKGSWEVVIAQMGQGNVAAAQTAQEAIDYLSPDLLFFVGAAGGLKDVEPGDVVAANKVYQYASGKAAAQFYPRAEVGIPSNRLVHRARAVVVNEEWQQRIRGTP